MSDNLLRKVFITVVVAFKVTVYILYYEIHLKYCQDTDVYINKSTIYFNNGNQFCGKRRV